MFGHTGANANCTNGDLRLRGRNSSLQGRVEICYAGHWGTVCDNLWGTNDAKVVCRHLGFSSYGNLITSQLRCEIKDACKQY